MKPLALTNVIEFPRPAPPPGLRQRRRAGRIIAVGGGKGGIGKTMVSVNLGVALAAKGKRVVMVDADLGGANLHTCLGVSQPTLTLSDFLLKKTARLEDVMVPAGVDNLSLIAGARDVLGAANPKHQQKLKLLRNLQALAADYVVLDLGAGTSFNVLDFFLIADHGVVVLLPEPTSVENAYRFIKAAFFRRLQNVEDKYGITDLLEQAGAGQQGAVRTPHEVVTRVKARDLALGEKLEAELGTFTARLVVNQSRGPADGEVGAAVVAAWKKFFGLSMDYLGAVSYDDEAWKAVRKRRPILLERPDSEAARGLLRVAENLLALDAAPHGPVTP
ncbi:MAG: P-loop NTPase [Myxococcaceae bacterium]